MATAGERNSSPLRTLVCGAVAGLTVDIALFPLDTVKTRMQSAQGFLIAGGFRNCWNGIGSAAIGSAPGAAIFFAVYEASKQIVQKKQKQPPSPHILALTHCGAAAVAEIAACLVRVPTDNVKQKQQAGLTTSFSGTCRMIYERQKWKGFFKGYGTTLMREIPFSMMQFPLYEAAKLRWKIYYNQAPQPWECAVLGAGAGAAAAAATTPVDVAKTRMMLGQAPGGLLITLKNIYRLEGYSALFSGIKPRTAWISIGGFVFFGSYEGTHKILNLIS